MKSQLWQEPSQHEEEERHERERERARESDEPNFPFNRFTSSFKDKFFVCSSNNPTLTFLLVSSHCI